MGCRHSLFPSTAFGDTYPVECMDTEPIKSSISLETPTQTVQNHVHSPPLAPPEKSFRALQKPSLSETSGLLNSLLLKPRIYWPFFKKKKEIASFDPFYDKTAQISSSRMNANSELQQEAIEQGGLALVSQDNSTSLFLRNTPYKCACTKRSQWERGNTSPRQLLASLNEIYRDEQKGYVSCCFKDSPEATSQAFFLKKRAAEVSTSAQAACVAGALNLEEKDLHILLYLCRNNLEHCIALLWVRRHVASQDSFLTFLTKLIQANLSKIGLLPILMEVIQKQLPILSECFKGFMDVRVSTTSILLESSSLGSYIMLPWNEEDMDIKNNVWIDVSCTPSSFPAFVSFTLKQLLSLFPKETDISPPPREFSPLPLPLWTDSALFSSMANPSAEPCDDSPFSQTSEYEASTTGSLTGLMPASVLPLASSKHATSTKEGSSRSSVEKHLHSLLRGTEPTSSFGLEKSQKATSSALFESCGFLDPSGIQNLSPATTQLKSNDSTDAFFCPGIVLPSVFSEEKGSFPHASTFPLPKKEARRDKTEAKVPETNSLPSRGEPGASMNYQSKDTSSAVSDKYARLFSNIKNGWKDEKWTDPDGFMRLSEKQQQKFHSWRRLSDIIKSPVVIQDKPSSRVIRQGFVGDCSFLSSLAVLADYENRTDIPILSSIISPQMNVIETSPPASPSTTPLSPFFHNQEYSWRSNVYASTTSPSSSLSRKNPLSHLKTQPLCVQTPVSLSRLPPTPVRRPIIPLVNPKGMYACRLYFNGVPRKVLIDDFVPTRKDGYILSAHSRNRSELWVTLLEKSFVKIMGGSYFMQGSNPGADLYHLTGWIPETIPFRSDIHTGSPGDLRPIVTGIVQKKGSGSKISSKRLAVDETVNAAEKRLAVSFSMDPLLTQTSVNALSPLEPELSPTSQTSLPSTFPFLTTMYSPNQNTFMEEDVFVDDVNVEDPKWDAIWKILYSGLVEGRCLACLGTSEVADAAPSGLDFPEGVSVSSGIVARHAYSILNFKEIKEFRLLYIKNPWGSVRWGGKFSPSDLESWTAEFRSICKYDPKKAHHWDNGCFWIQWKDVIRWFSHLYICWNVHYFPFQVETHDKWVCSPLLERSSLNDDSHLVAYNPQFVLSIDAASFFLMEETASSSATAEMIEICILFTRHVKERKRDVSQRYLALHVFSGKERVTCPPPPEKQGVYSNGECSLVKFHISSEKSKEACTETLNYVLVVSQYSQKDEFNFTLKVYSNANVQLQSLPPLVPPFWHSLYFRGEWRLNTAGGCSNNMWSYFTNPHLRLYMPETAEVICFLECAQEYSVNFRIFNGPVATARLLRTGRALSSGPYRAGCCSVRCTLTAGVYTLIVSTFVANDVGPYQLCFHCAPMKTLPTISHLPYPYASPPLLDVFYKNISFHNVSPATSILIVISVDTLTDVSFRLDKVDSKLPSLFPSLSICRLNLAVPNFPILHQNSNADITWDCSLHLMSSSSDFKEINDVSSVDRLSSLSLCQNVAHSSEERLKKMPIDSSLNQEEVPECCCSLLKAWSSCFHQAILSNKFIVVQRSDLEGGLSQDGRVTSSSALDLYRQKGIVTLTLATLSPKFSPYVIRVTSSLKNGFVGSGELHLMSSRDVRVCYQYAVAAEK